MPNVLRFEVNGREYECYEGESNSLEDCNAARVEYVLHPVIAFQLFRRIACLSHISDKDMAAHIVAHSPTLRGIPGYRRDIENMTYQHGIKCETCDKIQGGFGFASTRIQDEHRALTNLSYRLHGVAICPTCSGDLATIQKLEADAHDVRVREYMRKERSARMKQMHEQRAKEKAALKLLNEMGIKL